MTAAKKPRGARTPASRQVLGHKGGEKKQKKPTVASNDTGSIATAQLVYIWSWGPIVGPVDGLKSVKLDGTPLVAEDGTVNYPGVKWQFRSGELHQERLAGITEASNEIQVGQELRTQTPYLRSINNAMLDAVRVRLSWPQLTSQDSNGNISGVRIEYAIDVATDGGPYQTLVASEVNRKNITKYERDHRVELPAGSRWTVRVRRITPEAGSEFVQDGMYVEAIAELVDSDQEYPLTAVGGIEYDAQQFGGDIAKIAVLMRGRIVKVPANYNPETRTYATAGTGTSGGIWDGTFKEAYTNNPAWVLYDLVLNPYYGLGERINASMVNRWSLYRIAQFCDQLVPDGQGGQEPRFTCNLYLQKQADAWAVIQDLASIFHGLAFWDGSQIVVNADMPQDSAYTYTMAQIIGGNAVSYQGSKWRDRHSQAIVSFDDPAQGFETDKEPVFDEDAIAEFGVRELSVEAPGCTSRGQAQRAGNWALMTEQLQTRGTSIRVGLDGYIPKPGKVISLADPMLAGRANGGRIAAVDGRVVTVDRDIEVPTGARLLVNLPSGKAEARQVRSVTGRSITVMADYSEVPEAECGWALDYDDLKLMQFYVRNVTRPEWHQFQLELIQHEPSKFSAIDYGTMIDDRPISVLPPGVQAAPARVLITSHAAIDQGIAVTTMTIGWDAAPGAVAYEVEWRWGSRDWVRVPVTGGLTVDVRGVYAGQYLARVRAISAMDVSSIPTTSMLTEVAGKTTPPPAVTHLATESLLFGIGLKWGFPAGAEDTQRTELWYSAGTVLAEATKLADLAYPQDKHTLQGLRAGQRFYFWARLVDKSGNVGPWFPSGTTLVTGQASADAGPILEQIKDQITESELGKELTSKIEKIALIDGNGPGSVNDRLSTAKTELAKQISDVNNALSTTKGNLQQQITAVSADVSAAKTDLQQQIANVSALAGSLPYRKDKTYTASQSALGADGKLYQALKAVPLNTPPPNADYWTDVGQAVVTANGVAARVSKVETDVSTLDGKATAQASQLSGLQTSLTTTNGNVTAAQNAADAANALAGGKGKVIIQAVAPAAADRLAQNLWIDTTSNANTPKRWNGSAWVAVTDKAATDAAAAAQSALALAQTKADASVVSSLTTRVSDAEGKLTSQATRLDGMQTSIEGKASSQALQQVTSRVTATEQKDAAQDQQLTSQSQTLTSLKDSVDKKADSSAVQSLSNEVKQQGQTLTSQGQSLVTINSTIGQLGGENWIYNPSFEKAGSGGLADGWARAGASGVTANPSIVPSALATGEFAQRIDVTGVSASAWARIGNPGSRRIKVSPGTAVTLSAFARGTPGLSARCEIQFLNAAGSGISGPPVAANISMTGDYARLSHSVVAPEGTVDCNYFVTCYGTSTIGTAFLEVDRCQLEFSPSMSGWRDNGAVNADATTAAASAVQSISGRVDQTESALTSQSGAITQLSNSLTTTNGNVTAAQKAAQDASDLVGGKGKVIVQASAPATADRLAQNLWIDTMGNANTPKRWTGSAWVAVTDKVATDAAAAAATALSEVAKKADASALNSLKSTVEQQGQSLTAQGQSITDLTASVGNLGASGVNLLPAEYSVFGAKLPDGMYSNYQVNLATAADVLALRGYALKVTSTQASSNAFGLATSLTREGCNMSFKRQKYIFSYWARAEVDGQQVSAYARVLLADGANFKTGPATIVTLSKEWKRYSVVMDLTSADYSGEQFQIAVQPNRNAVAGRVVYYDRFMVEAAVNNATEPSAFVTGNSFDQSLANAAATAALDAKVAVSEGAITSASGQITELRNSLGDVGGENLIYNPSFEKLGASGLADGWAIASGSGATVSPSVVASALNPKESAQRIDVTGLSTSVWARIGNPSSRRIALKPGTPVTLSAYMRGTAGLNVRAEIQFLNSAGSGLPGPLASFTVASGNFARISLSAVVPDGAVECNFFVTCYGTGAISTAFMEVDRAQFELSAVMTGWRDNGQVVGADQSATSSAVDSLSSVVSQQAGKIDSASSRTTALENAVNSTSSGLATKASTAAVNTISGRVTATETGLTAASNNINRLSSQIGAVGGTGSNLIPAEYATFTAALPSMHKASTLTLSSEQDAAAYSGSLLKADSPSGSAWLYLAASATDYTLRLTAGRQYIFSVWAKASAAHGVAVRLRYQSSDGSAVEVALSSVIVGTTLSRVSTVVTVPAAAAGPASVVLYTQAGAAAGATWFDGFMLEEKVGESTAPSAFSPGTSTRQAAGQATALTALDTKVTQQGTRIESEAKRTDGLYTSVGNTNAAVQTEAKARSDGDSALSTRITTAQAKADEATAAVQSEVTARANAVSAVGKRVDDTQASLGNMNAAVQQISQAQAGTDGKISATYSVRLQVQANGQYALAGIGAGIDNNGGILQSTVAVIADRFAVMNPAGNGMVLPFAIQNGQVFINDALISKLAVQNAIVGAGLQSSAMTSWGGPVMTVNFANGDIITRQATRANTYCVMNHNGIDVVVDGVRRVRMGVW